MSGLALRGPFIDSPHLHEACGSSFISPGKRRPPHPSRRRTRQLIQNQAWLTSTPTARSPRSTCHLPRHSLLVSSSGGLAQPFEILNATYFKDPQKKIGPVQLSLAQRILLIIHLALVAQTFGDVELEQIAMNKLRKRLQAEGCDDSVVSTTIQAIYADEYNPFPVIRGLRRIVVLDGCRRGFGRIFHATAQDLSRHAANNRIFCRDFAEVEEMDTRRPCK
jgi:hypothetical protein